MKLICVILFSLLPLLAHSQDRKISFPSTALITLTGDTVTQRDLHGKVVVLNFWFMTCAPCRLEIPDLNRLVIKYKSDARVRFIAISSMDEFDKISYFISRKPFDYEHGTQNKDWIDYYNVELFPTNVVVDRQGKMVYWKEGYKSDVFDELDKHIQSSLKDTVE
jgi:thiol-disulfide isomerase/thioredoxin